MKTDSRVPDFLVIGGMKCATTTLHHDLSQHPKIECGKKELNALTLASSGGNIESIYEQNYRKAPLDATLGDVSTTYSMLPQHPGVAEKARSIAGDGLKIIYVVREPIKRTLSHHQHMMNQAENQLGPDINLEIKRTPALIEFSRYDMQIEPWVTQFGLDNVCIVRFEDYVKDRARTLSSLFRFLSVGDHDLVIEDEGENRTGTARVAGPWLSRIYRSSTFQKIAKPLSPEFLRTAMRRLLLRKTKHATIAPTLETIDLIVDGIRDDQARFTKRFGWTEPLWDLETARASYAGKSDQR